MINFPVFSNTEYAFTPFMSWNMTRSDVWYLMSAVSMGFTFYYV